MRVVARMTGLSPDTIRAWERRYEAVVPERTSGNTRRYSAEDVRRLALLKELTEQGHTISGVARLHEPELQRLLTPQDAILPTRETPRTSALDSAQFTAESSPLDGVKEAYLTAVARLDARRASEILVRVATLLDARDVVLRVVAPILQEVGERWSHNELGTAHEHFVSAQLRGLVASLLRLSPPDRGARKILMTTPAGHRHEFGILAGALLASGRGYETIYLGPDLPDDELDWAASMSRADIVLLSVVRDVEPTEARRIGDALARVATRSRVWIGLPDGHPLVDATPFARHFHRYEDLDLALANWGG